MADLISNKSSIPYTSILNTGVAADIPFSVINPRSYQVGNILYGGYKIGINSLQPQSNIETLTMDTVEYIEAISITSNFTKNVSFQNLKVIGTSFLLYSTTFINSINIPNLQYAGSLSFQGLNSSLISSLSFPSLQFTSGMSITSTSTSLTSFSATSLMKVFAGLTLNTTTSTVFDFPLLTDIYGAVALAYPSNTFNISSFFPAINYIGGSLTVTPTSVVSINTSPLKIVGSFTISSAGTGITTIDMSSITHYYGALSLTNTQCVNLANFTFGSELKLVGSNNGTVGTVTFSGVKLNQASVDNILVRLAALDGTNGTTVFSNRTVTVSGGLNATPSATGLAAKSTLVARGCTVTNN